MFNADFALNYWYFYYSVKQLNKIHTYSKIFPYIKIFLMYVKMFNGLVSP